MVVRRLGMFLDFTRGGWLGHSFRLDDGICFYCSNSSGNMYQTSQGARIGKHFGWNAMQTLK